MTSQRRLHLTKQETLGLCGQRSTSPSCVLTSPGRGPSYRWSGSGSKAPAEFCGPGSLFQHAGPGPPFLRWNRAQRVPDGTQGTCSSTGNARCFVKYQVPTLGLPLSTESAMDQQIKGSYCLMKRENSLRFNDISKGKGILTSK